MIIRKILIPNDQPKLLRYKYLPTTTHQPICHPDRGVHSERRDLLFPGRGNDLSNGQLTTDNRQLSSDNPQDLSSRPRSSLRAEGPAVPRARQRFASRASADRQPTTDNRPLICHPDRRLQPERRDPRFPHVEESDPSPADKCQPTTANRLPKTQRDRRTQLASCPFADPSMTLHHYQVKKIQHQNALHSHNGTWRSNWVFIA